MISLSFTGYIISSNNEPFISLQVLMLLFRDFPGTVSQLGRLIPMRNRGTRDALSSDSVGTRSTVSR